MRVFFEYGGNDTFELSSGKDTIEDFNEWDEDVLKIDDVFSGIADPTLAVSGRDIILKFDSNNDGKRDAKTTLENAFRGSGNWEDGLGAHGDINSLNDALQDLLGYNGHSDSISLIM